MIEKFYSVNLKVENALSINSKKQHFELIYDYI